MPGLPASLAQKEMGARLKALREALDLSGAALGEMMGVAPNTVSSYETGRTKLDVIALARFLRHCGLSADYIMFGSIGRLPMDVASRVQGASRSAMGDARPVGRPRKPAVPLVEEVPAPSLERPRRLLHEVGQGYIAPPRKSQDV